MDGWGVQAESHALLLGDRNFWFKSSPFVRFLALDASPWNRPEADGLQLTKVLGHLCCSGSLRTGIVSFSRLHGRSLVLGG